MIAADHEVVITGASVCCNLGDDWASIEGRLRRGEPEPFEIYPPAEDYECRCRLIGLYPGDLSDKALGLKKAQGRFLGRASRLAYKAATAALAQSKLERSDLAVAVGSGTGDVDAHIDIQQRLEKTGSATRLVPTYIPRLMASTVTANLVNILRTTGPSFSAAAACAGGAYNIALAATLIASGQIEAALAGGAEVADPHFYVGFDAMRAYNGQDNDSPHRASRPYAADRAGFIFGEGAGVLVLERADVAKARGATVLGVLRGWGMSSDGDGEMVAPSREGAQRAMSLALSHAGVSPAQIDYVNTHGTSTPLGDVSEVDAIRALLDGRHVAYSSTKGYTGHTVSAAGAVEAAFTLRMLSGGFVAPSVNADPLDPALEEYRPVTEPTERQLETVMSNSFGFGGTNVALVLQRR